MLLIYLVYQFAFAGLYLASPVPKFEAQTIDDNISIGYGLALGDVDGDGKPDIILADKKQFVWYRNGDWKRFVLIENLTERDNVCIAARDIDGDGKVEIAVGAQWNPGETSDTAQSGSVHFLVRPQDATQPWKAVALHHEPTVHRMQWVQAADGSYYLVVLPLHGRGNKNGEGAGVKVFAYKFSKDPKQSWPIMLLDSSMHLTHNLAVDYSKPQRTAVYIAGKEGLKLVDDFTGKAVQSGARNVRGVDSSAGEIKIGQMGNERFFATIEPMHGVAAVVYTGSPVRRKVLDNQLKEGHALATGDFLNIGRDQVIAGWRVPNSENKVGIKMYVPRTNTGADWDTHYIDDNAMATEDIQVLDMNGDGKPDIVASGRATKNLKIYWNKNE